MENETAKPKKPQIKNHGKASLFGTGYDTVFFVLCFIVYLVLLCNYVKGEETNNIKVPVGPKLVVREVDAPDVKAKPKVTPWASPASKGAAGGNIDKDVAKMRSKKSGRSAQRQRWQTESEGRSDMATKKHAAKVTTDTVKQSPVQSDDGPHEVPLKRRIKREDETAEGGEGDAEVIPEEDAPPPTEAPTAATEAPVTLTEKITTTLPPPDPRTMVNFDIIYEDSQVLPWAEAAAEYAETMAGSGMKMNIVGRFHARKTHDAVGLVTRLCKHIDELNMNPRTKLDLILDLTRVGVSSEAVKIITRTLKIPTVSTSFGLKDNVREWSKLDDHQSRYLVRILPPSGIIGYVIRSITASQNMLSASIFVGSDIEITYEPTNLLADVPVRHHFVPMTSLDNLPMQIETEKKHGFRNFFFITSPANASIIMEQIHSMSQANQQTWFVITMEHGASVECGSCSSNVSVVHFKPAETKYSREIRDFMESKNLEGLDMLDNMFYVNLVMDSIQAVVHQKQDGMWPEHQIGRIPCSNFDLRRNYSDVHANLLSYFKAGRDLYGSYSITENGYHHGNFKLEMVKIEPQPAQPHGMGSWTAGLADTAKLELLPRGETALQSYKTPTVYHVGTVIHPPWVMRKANCDEKKLQETNKFAHCYEGYHIDVLNALAKELNFNYTIATYTTFGYLNSSAVDDWTGVMKAILEYKVDIAIGTLQYMPERLKVADLTRTYGPMIGFTFIMPKTLLYDTSAFKFLTILEPQVWWCIVGAYVFTSLLIFVFDKFGPTSAQNNKEELDEEEEPPRVFDFRECFWFCITSMTAQGGGEAPRGLSGRLVAATWWLFSFIIMASYTANMAAYLTVPGLTKPIMSFDELINQQAVQFAPVEHSAAWHYFDRMANVEQVFYERWRDLSLDDDLSTWERSHLAVWTYPISDKFTKFWQSMVDNKPPKTLEEALTRLLRGRKRTGVRKFAFIAEETDLRWIMMNHCGFRMVGEPFAERAYTIGVRKGSPLKEEINRALYKLEKHRVMDAAWDRWWRNNPVDKKCDWEDTTQAIPMNNLTGVWAAGGIGLALAIIVMFIERLALTTRIWLENKDIKGAVKKLLRRKKHA